MSTRVLTPSRIASIVNDVGLEALLDELITRLHDAFEAHDPDVVETMARSGFRYTTPDFGLIERVPSAESGRRVAIKTNDGRHRTRHEHWRSGLTVFDSTGWAIEDLFVAELILDHAERPDEGFDFDLQPIQRDPYDPDEFLCR